MKSSLFVTVILAGAMLDRGRDEEVHGSHEVRSEK
jgi:hypothetical protein